MTDSLRDKLRALADEWEQTANKLPPSIQGGVRLSHARELRALLDAEQDETADECCCETSPPEFGGPIPDRDCPVHAPEGQPEGSERDEPFFADAVTGEPCPRRGSILCDLPWTPEHRHVAIAAAPAPVPDDEAGKLFAALSYWDQDRDAGPLSDYVTIRVREAVRAHGERIAAAVRALPTTRTQAWRGGWDSVSLDDVLRIARDLTREAVGE